MRSIVLHVNRDDGLQTRINAGVTLAHLHDGWIRCVAITPLSSYIISDPFGGIYTLAALVESANEREAQERALAEARLRQERVRFDYLQLSGEIASGIVSASLLADVIVLSLARGGPEGHQIGAPLPVVADVALHTRAPVLAIPPELARLDPSGPALVAWNGKPEGAAALRASLSYLRCSSSIRVLTVCEAGENVGQDLALDYLACHGLRAELQERLARDRHIADVILDEATALHAAVIVMGVYGHSRAREWLLGGVTRTLLFHSTVPLLLAH